MRTLRDLLATWEAWSARDSLLRALRTSGGEEARIALRSALVDSPTVEPLDVLRDTTELIARLKGWQWQAVGAARAAGESWDAVGAAIGVDGERARAAFVEALDRQEAVRPGCSIEWRTLT